jgi:hypothetical protein
MLFINILYKEYCISVKKFLDETWPKIYVSQDPDPVKNCLDPQHCSDGLA